MSSNACVTCRKVFSRRNNLVRHINNRQTSCQPATHHCDRCDKGLSSYQTLWEHQQKCLSSPVEKQPTKVISHSIVSSDPYADDQSSSLKVIPYLLPSKDITPAKRVKMEMPLAPQKKFGSKSRVTDSSAPITLVYSDAEDEN